MFPISNKCDKDTKKYAEGHRKACSCLQSIASRVIECKHYAAKGNECYRKGYQIRKKLVSYKAYIPINQT